MFSDSIITNFLLILTVNNFESRLIFDEVRRTKKLCHFGPPCRFFVIHFVAESAETQFNVVGFNKTNAFSEITQNNGYYAVQCHTRSLILVPIESPYATFY